MLIGVAPIKEAFEFEHQESQRGDARGFFCLWTCGTIQHKNSMENSTVHIFVIVERSRHYCRNMYIFLKS